MKYRIRQPVINKWAVVDAGDNPEAKIVLFKRQGGPLNKDVDNNNSSNKKGDETIMTLNEILSKMEKGEALTKEEQAFVKSETEAQANEINTLKEAGEAKDTELSDVKKSLDEAKAKIEKKDPPKPEEILEKAAPEVKEEFKKMQDRLEKSEKLNTESSERLQKVEDGIQKEKYLAKAKTLTGIEGKPAEVGELLQKIAKSSPEDYPEVEKLLESASKRITEGDLLKEKGSNEEGVTGDKEQEIQKRMVELKKAKPELTDEQAYDEVLQSDDKLYSSEE